MNDITSHMNVSCHIPPLAPAEPALHLQSFEASLPAGDNELDGQEVHMLEDAAPEAAKNVPTEQSRQAVDAELAWYLPGEHSTHVPPPPLAPAEPALHLQSFEASLPAGCGGVLSSQARRAGANCRTHRCRICACYAVGARACNFCTRARLTLSATLSGTWQEIFASSTFQAAEQYQIECHQVSFGQQFSLN